MRALIAIAFVFAVALPFSPAGAAMLTEAVCAKLAKHEARGNVAYQPGVTTRGGKVVPANVRKQDDPAPTPTSVDLTVLLKDRYRVPRDRKLLNGEIPVSRLFVRSDGRMNYAGQPLTVEDQRQISLHCLRAWGRQE